MATRDPSHPLWEHDPDESKDGKEVSQHIEDAVRDLRGEPTVLLVLCHHHRTGRIGIWTNDKTIDGDALRAVRAAGYRVDFVKQREKAGNRVGYLEAVPTEQARSDLSFSLYDN
jgi:hypothetical protein